MAIVDPPAPMESVTRESRLRLREAARLTHHDGEGVDVVEKIGCSSEQVDLVSRHKRAKAQRVALDELDHGAVVLSGGVERQVDPLQAGASDPELIRPHGEHPLNRG